MAAEIVFRRSNGARRGCERGPFGNLHRAGPVPTGMTALNPPGSGPLVLLVEDEPLVRMLNLEMLEEAGFRVIDANDADEAFEILKRRSDQVRVVLTDVDMPGSMDGFEFARLVAQGWPATGVLVISGKTAPGPRDLPRNAVFLAKPYGTDELVQTLKRLAEQLPPRPE